MKKSVPNLKLENTECGRRARITISALVLLPLLISLGWLFFEAICDPKIPFLKTDKRAQWISYPLSLEIGLRNQNYINIQANFEKTFSLENVPPQALVHIKAFESFNLSINDCNVYAGSGANANWKKTADIECSRYLKPGNNKLAVRVQCRYGPPALWAYTTGLPNNIHTDTGWRVSFFQSPPILASVADDCKLYQSDFNSFRPLPMLIRNLPTLMSFFAVIAAAFLVYDSKKFNSFTFAHVLDAFASRIVLIILTCVWILIFLINLPNLPMLVGFDANAHIQYIDYILRTGTLPLANQSWQAYQAPLFYVVEAAVAAAAQIFSPQLYNAHILKAVPFLCGLGLIYMTYYAAKTVFPNSKTKQLISAVFVAVLPMNIYISHYVSNESMCAFLMALSILLALQLINSRSRLLPRFCLLGAVLGLALLTKVTALILLPVITVVLFYEFAIKRGFNLKLFLGHCALMFLIILLIAGWFYWRNVEHFGKPVIGNWDPGIMNPWWQDPGFHTLRFFSQFGKVFQFPYFAGFFSSFDSLYATFWGDSQAGSTVWYIVRPGWNYQYMSLVYILAIPATILIIVGIILAVPKLFRACQSCWLLILGSVFIMFIGLIYMQLRLPYSGQAKAFYGLFMALPAGLLFAYGFDFINNYLKHLKFARAFFYAWFGLLAVSILMAFHVSKTVNVDTRADSRHLNQAIENCKLFIQRNPDSRAGYSTLAYFYSKQSRFDEAVLYYKKAFEMGENSPEILLEYSSAILNKSSLTDDDKLEALRYARLSCEMSGYLDSFSVLNLAEAYKSVGKIPDAMKMARRAHELALSAGQMNIVELARQKIKYYASLSQTKLVEGSSENRNH